MRDFHTGKRETPAFSQASCHSLQNEDEDAWSQVTEELLNGGADAKSIQSQKPIIKRWIEDVCTEDLVDDATTYISDAATNYISDAATNPLIDEAMEEVNYEPIEIVEHESADGDNLQVSKARFKPELAEDLLPPSHSPHAFERWEQLSSHWEGLTTYWIHRLHENQGEIRGQTINEEMSRQVTDLSAAGANLFHAVVELQRLRASSEKDFQKWYSEIRAEQEWAHENNARIQEELRQEKLRWEENIMMNIGSHDG